MRPVPGYQAPERCSGDTVYSVERQPITCDDLERLGEQAVLVLEALATPSGWNGDVVPGLDWTSRTVVDHLCNTLAFYANHAVTRATEHQPRIRSLGDADLEDADLARSLAAWVLLLSTVLRSLEPTARGWHRLGMADPEGFAALACNEIVIHTDDVARAHSTSFQPEPELSERLLARLFPDVANELRAQPEDLLRWANGRSDLPGRPRRSNWQSHPAPLA